MDRLCHAGDLRPELSTGARSVLLVALFAVALVEVGDGLLEAGVATDDAVDEAGGLVEVAGWRHQVRVLPHGVAGVDTGGLRQLLPQRGGLPQLPGAQFEADEGGEGLLGRTTGR